MTRRFNPGRLGDWIVFCDICGQKYYASETTKLSTYTGRGELIVCKKDADKLDYGLVPYKPPAEQNIPWVRINHTNTANATPLVDLENMALIYALVTSQDSIQIAASQDSVGFVVLEPI